MDADTGSGSDMAGGIDDHDDRPAVEAAEAVERGGTGAAEDRARTDRFDGGPHRLDAGDRTGMGDEYAVHRALPAATGDLPADVRPGEASPESGAHRDDPALGLRDLFPAGARAMSIDMG